MYRKILISALSLGLVVPGVAVAGQHYHHECKPEVSNNLEVSNQIWQDNQCHPDLCANIEGWQKEVPAGLVQDGENCVTDVCPNIDGIQLTLPSGFEFNSDKQCVEIPPVVVPPVVHKTPPVVQPPEATFHGK